MNCLYKILILFCVVHYSTGDGEENDLTHISFLKKGIIATDVSTIPLCYIFSIKNIKKELNNVNKPLEEIKSYVIKCVILGDSCVGKTSIINYYLTNKMKRI